MIFALQRNFIMCLSTEGTPSLPGADFRSLALTQAREMTLSPFLRNFVHWKKKTTKKSNISEENASLGEIMCRAKGKGEQEN